MDSASSKRSSRATIAAIVDAAAIEFSERGFDGTRMDDIALRAKVTKQLIYHYYGTKTELYEAILEHASNLSAPNFEARPTDYDALEPAHAFTELMGQIFDHYMEHPMLGAFIVDQNLHHAEHITSRNKTRSQFRSQIDILDTILKRGADSGVFRSDVNAPLFFASSVTVLLACFSNGNTIAMCLDVDAIGTDVKAHWRGHSIDLLLASLHAR